MKFGRFVCLVIMPAILACGCLSGDESYKAPKFKHESPLNFDIICKELNCSPSNIAIADDYIIISGYTSSSGDTFFVYGKNGELICSGIKCGRGPSETISGYVNMSVYGDAVQYNDLMSGERLSFSLKNFLDDGALCLSKEDLKLPGWCTYARQSPGGDEVRVITRNSKKDPDSPPRTIQFEQGGHIYEFAEPAIADKEIAYFSSLQKSIAFSPDGKKMVYSGDPGFILEIFSLEHGIERTHIKRYLPPTVTLANGAYVQNDGYIFGGGKLTASDHFIYVTYDGKHTGREWHASGGNCLLYNNIAVFDWNGSPQSLYTTDYRVMNLAVDKDSIVYACLENIEGERFIGRAKIK